MGEPNLHEYVQHSAHHRFANPCGYMGVGQMGTGMGLLQGTHTAGTVGFFYFYLHIASVIFTGFSTWQMSATNLLFTYLLFVGTNIHRGKQHPKEKGACGTSI